MTSKRVGKRIRIASTAGTGAPATAVFHPPILPVHGQKLAALANNRKLPNPDKARVQAARERYDAWVKAMDEMVFEGDALLEKLVALLNDYKHYIEIDFIYDSPGNFLYRQSGQLKVGNSILEEFLPRLADTRLVPGLGLLSNVKVGPHNAFAAFTIVGDVHTPLSDSIFIRQKNQDYAICKPVFLKASTTPAFEAGTTFETELSVAYLAAECKTNLDKTMFNEGLEASRALKQAVAGARYLLICEWLDMPPIDTKLTEIDEAIVLRKAKRLGSGFRERLGSTAGRKAARGEFMKYYEDHPLALECFQRVVMHLNQVFPSSVDLDEETVLKRGYF
jgi:Bpu10I restriction endonuclease